MQTTYYQPVHPIFPIMDNLPINPLLSNKLEDHIKQHFVQRLLHCQEDFAYGCLAAVRHNTRHHPSLKDCKFCILGHLVASLIHLDFPIETTFVKHPDAVDGDYIVKFIHHHNQHLVEFDTLLPDHLLQLLHLTQEQQLQLAHFNDIGHPPHLVVDYIQSTL